MIIIELTYDFFFTLRSCALVFLCVWGVSLYIALVGMVRRGKGFSFCSDWCRVVDEQYCCFFYYIDKLHLNENLIVVSH